MGQNLDGQATQTIWESWEQVAQC